MPSEGGEAAEEADGAPAGRGASRCAVRGTSSAIGATLLTLTLKVGRQTLHLSLI